MKFPPVLLVPVIHTAISLLTLVPTIGSEDGLSALYFVLWTFPTLTAVNSVYYQFVGIPWLVTVATVLLINFAVLYGAGLAVRLALRRVRRTTQPGEPRFLR